MQGEGRGTVVLGQERNNPERRKEHDSHVSVPELTKRVSGIWAVGLIPMGAFWGQEGLGAFTFAVLP